MMTYIHEHYNGFRPYKPYDFGGGLSFKQHYFQQFHQKKRNKKVDCFRIISDETLAVHNLSNSYFIGVDWIIEHEKAIYIAPKIDKIGMQTDYLKMLFSALKHPIVSRNTDDLFEIKLKSPFIEIEREQDTLTPLLVVHFLSLVKSIVRKGLKKSYYKVESVQNARIKGKIIVSKTIKHNLQKNAPLETICCFDEFGFNNLENRLLKKTLVFIQSYLPTLKIPHAKEYTTEVLNYITPAFESISDKVSLNDIKHSKTNSFYKEYAEAIRLSKLILNQFGYNINNTKTGDKIKTPPFWIDMSKLFELYILGLLKDQFNDDILYGDEAKANYGLPDYLLKIKGQETVIDAKYKLQYNDIKEDQGNISMPYDIENIRQLSGYSRDKKVIEKLGVDKTKLVGCLIIYPLGPSAPKINTIDLEVKNEISEFENFYKIGISLPQIKSKMITGTYAIH
jgi:5-methylcytosine-specific restriction enzyme subunit McrC